MCVCVCVCVCVCACVRVCMCMHAHMCAGTMRKSVSVTTVVLVRVLILCNVVLWFLIAVEVSCAGLSVVSVYVLRAMYLIKVRNKTIFHYYYCFVLLIIKCETIFWYSPEYMPVRKCPPQKTTTKKTKNKPKHPSEVKAINNQKKKKNMHTSSKKKKKP